ncbi:hypothetical protein GCM10025782_31730 [Pedococcus ginsenosidimutans]|uniref:Uncharacterized protein n=1 Tax=Pedococcus ginsenosidimutans TaxID=490570 RepID=A0ABP8YJ13_9MICO
MTRRRQHTSTLRLVAALGAAAALLGAGATTCEALMLPEPVATGVGGVTSTVTGATGSLGLPVPGSTTPAPSGSTTTPSHPAAGSTSGSTASGSTASGGSRGAGSPRSSATSPSATSAQSRPAGDGVVADTPAATACLIPSRGASPAVEVDLRAAGVDLSSPLVRQFPQALAPCPAGAVPAGDHVASLDAAVQGLLGACVRVTRQVVPLQTTLVVLDHDVIRELTAAGVPLQRLVVPCPRAATSHTPAGAPAGSGPSRPAAGDRPGAASALPGRLAFTGGDFVPLAAVGSGLLWLGLLLSRRARSLSARAGRG